MDDHPLLKALLEKRDTLLGFILTLTRNYEVAEEIFQETALAIVTEAQRGTTVANFMPWAREIARRRIHNYYHKQSQRAEIEQLSGTLQDAIVQAYNEFEPPAEIRLAHQKFLAECVTRLAGKARDVIQHRYKERMSLKEMAVVMAWQEASIKVALSRARKFLVDCVQQKIRTQETV